MIIELKIFQVISGLAVSILLDVYLSTLVLYLEEEGPSTIIRWDLTSGCHMHKVEGNHFHFSLSLCVCVFVCMCVHICELMRVCSPSLQVNSVQKWTRIGSIKCTRDTGLSRAVYKTPSDMFATFDLSLQLQLCALRNPKSFLLCVFPLSFMSLSSSRV